MMMTMCYYLKKHTFYFKKDQTSINKLEYNIDLECEMQLLLDNVGANGASKDSNFS